MISTLIPFDEILESVKDDTGITNIANIKEKCRRWLFRAEQELGYNSARVFKSITYTKDNVNWSGPRLSLPTDCLEVQDIFVDGVFQHTGSFKQYGNNIRFHDSFSAGTSLKLYYYGIMYDGEGNPACIRNHAEAVVKYIIWKMFSAKTFLDPNRYGRRLMKDYEQDWMDKRDGAIGNEAMPQNLEEWEQLSTIINFSSKDAIIYYPRGYGENKAVLEAKSECVLKEEELDVKVYAWQYDSLTTDIAEAPSISQVFLDTTNAFSLQALKEGMLFPYNNVGRIAFAIQGAEKEDAYRIYDTFNSDVTDLVFNKYYNTVLNLSIYISKTYYSHSNIFYKLKDN